MNSYAELKAALIAWPDLAGEPDMEAIADTLIALGEARIYRTLRMRWMVQAVPYSGVAISEAPLPVDYLEMDRVLGPDGQSLESRPADELSEWGYKPDEPTYYAIDRQSILFAPEVDGYTLYYYSLPASLQSTDTNWLFQREPGLFLYAALIEASIFNRENEQEAGRYRGVFDETMAALQLKDEESQHPRSQPLRSVVGAGRKDRIT